MYIVTKYTGFAFDVIKAMEDQIDNVKLIQKEDWEKIKIGEYIIPAPTAGQFLLIEISEANYLASDLSQIEDNQILYTLEQLGQVLETYTQYNFR